MIILNPHETREAGGCSRTLRKCIWMASGSVSYKLCNLDYNCEVCPFDRAIRENTPPSPQPSPQRWALEGKLGRR